MVGYSNRYLKGRKHIFMASWSAYRYDFSGDSGDVEEQVGEGGVYVGVVIMWQKSRILINRGDRNSRKY